MGLASDRATDVCWLAEYAEDDVVCFRIGTNGPEVVAEWMDVARLVARRDGSGRRLEFEPDVDPRNAEKIRRGSAWLLLRHLDRELALHGASVAIDAKAVILLGRSGAGKSTLATELCDRGADLLADDAVGIDRDGERFVVPPREVHHWLDGAARRALGRSSDVDGKEPIVTRRIAERSVSLAAFVELVFDDGAAAPSVSRRTGVDAMGALVPQVARFVIDEPERQKWELDLLHRVVEAVPCYRLERPRGFEHLSVAAELVEATLRDL
jgi:hypothetical protein